MKRRREVLVLFILFIIYNGSGAETKVQYDNKALNVPISDDGAIDLVNHWTEQAYSGLFAAVAAKK